MTDYTRSGLQRFGTPIDLGDTLQEMIITKDRSFTFILDKGNNQEQFNVKQSGERMRNQMDEVVTPEIDSYRLQRWAEGFGQGVVSTDKLTADTITEAILRGTLALSNALVPRANRTLFVRESVYIYVKLNDRLRDSAKLTEQALIRGEVGKMDGMPVVAVPDSYFPAGISFMIKYKGSSVDPVKLSDLRIHVDPVGVSGEVL